MPPPETPKDRLEYADIMRINVDSCTRATRSAMHVGNRQKPISPELTFYSPVTVKSYQIFMEKYAETAQHQAANLKVVAALLKEDRYYTAFEFQKQEQINIVQNTFDSFKYSTHLLKCMTTLSIPLDQ
ncbi:Oidioi.mRNA.OKI2018_I69.chr2.g7973.t1.cds [Oikopleura dioica]|uniref:Oidioi.mRNA.OKI2018_I69.chr2.g7973.t1.cds n=1 Tax=Oikopleura dioica TaxID=34765 RepID=A0ABN7T8B8_OIKDI|nr:Oidioi.mRNA.OKI2018_I69.chr2.g7973.t1.cds [Oikopleura dioica]